MKKAFAVIITVVTALLFVLNPVAVDNSALTDNPVFEDRYYNQLNNNAQQVYDLLIDNIEDMKDGVSTVSGNVDPIPGNISQAVISSAFSAARMDNLMFYFVDVTKLSISFTSYGTGKTTLTIGLKKNETNYYRGSYSGQAALDAELTSINTVINSIVTEAEKKSSDYEKLKYVHDWLVTNNTYNSYVANGDTESADESAWTIVSAFLSENDATKGPVCEGYSKAFMICAQKLGFECILAPGDGITNSSSGGHMWNYVKLDGKWYAVDVTWDDPLSNKPIYPIPTTYFLCGSNTDIGAGNTFSESHKSDTGSYMYADFALPPLEANAYQYISSKVATTCSASATTVTYGEQTEINVSISGDGTVNGGKVSAYNKTELIGSATVSDGKAKISAGLPAGSYSLTLKYEGTDSFEASQSTVNCSVSKKTLTMRLTASTVTDKVYDGTTSAAVKVTVVFDGAVGNDNPKPAPGYVISAEFINSDPGNNKKVTLSITGIKLTDTNYSCTETFTATIYGNILPAPVTTPPVTEPPVTELPVTQPPVTQPPVTEPPVTQPPATEPPVTQPPVTEPPVTQSPATEPPVTQSPVTQPPTTAVGTVYESSTTDGNLPSTAAPGTVETGNNTTNNGSSVSSDTNNGTDTLIITDTIGQGTAAHNGETINTATIIILFVVAGTILISVVVTVTVVIVKKR